MRLHRLVKDWFPAMPGARTGAAAGLCALLSGCTRAPSYSILGSFFPVWLFCGIAGILLAFGVHVILVRLERDHELEPPLLVYPSLAMLFTLGLWLVFFS